MPTTSLKNVVIESERLRLRPTSEVYAEAFFPEFTPAITALMGPAPPVAIEETQEFLRRARASIVAGVEMQVVVLLKATEEFIGHGGFFHLDTATPELGIWIKEAAHRQGYGREAVAALAAWALDNLSFDYLKYPVDRRNVPSRRIPESLGGRIEFEYEWTNYSGRLLYLLEYRIYPEDLRLLFEARL